jgi:hypothetical protein
MVETVRDEIIHLAESIRALERQLEVALAKRHVELNYNFGDGDAYRHDLERLRTEARLPEPH